MTKSELISNGYIYVMTASNGVEIWGKMINNDSPNELLHYYHYLPTVGVTLGEPMIVSRQMLCIAKRLGEVFNIPI